MSSAGFEWSDAEARSARRVWGSVNRLLVVTVVVLLVLLLAAFSVSANSSGTLSGADVGFSNGFPNRNPKIFGAELDASKAGSATWYRGDVVNLRQADAVVPQVKARGLKMLAILGGSTPTVDVTTVRAIVSKYRSSARIGIDAVEVLNEPNLFGRDNAAQYLRLLKQLVPVIRRADPRMTIVIGALGPHGTESSSTSPYGYLKAMYRANHGHSLPGDAVSYHGYSYPNAPRCPLRGCPRNTFQQAPDIHALMAAHGDGSKRLWCTEAGTPTGTGAGAQTNETQAAWVTQYLSIWPRFGDWTGPFFYYQVRNRGSDPANVEHNFGLLDSSFKVKRTGDGTPTAYERFRQALK
jgi:hypothetical protein